MCTEPCRYRPIASEPQPGYRFCRYRLPRPRNCYLSMSSSWLCLCRWWTVSIVASHSGRASDSSPSESLPASPRNSLQCCWKTIQTLSVRARAGQHQSEIPSRPQTQPLMCFSRDAPPNLDLLAVCRRTESENYQRTPKVRGINSVGEFVVNIWW